MRRAGASNTTTLRKIRLLRRVGRLSHRSPDGATRCHSKGLTCKSIATARSGAARVGAQRCCFAQGLQSGGLRASTFDGDAELYAGLHWQTVPGTRNVVSGTSRSKLEGCFV
jgi:hypothetical protein